MDKNNQVEQDKLEQEQRREFERLQMEQRAERQRAEIEQGQDKESGEIEGGSMRRARVERKALVGKVKKGKKNIKTFLLIGRIFASGGLDFAAWMQLVKERPLLTIVVVICLIILIMTVFIGLTVLIMYLFCQSIVGGMVSGITSLFTEVPDFCSYF